MFTLELLKRLSLGLLLTLSLGVFINPASASVGSGVGIGEIVVHERLMPGGVYRLPAWPVLNTGDTEATYRLQVEGVDPNWFEFSQNNFRLGPQESKLVNVTIVLPFVARAGVYNVYLENQLVPSGPVGIGPAAATKLRFTVGESSSVLGAATQRAYTWFELNRRLCLLIFLLLDLFSLYVIIKKFFRISFKIESKSKK
jgi:hypothetical protein